jgi:DNA invertase Pin-like site-specific DNA recombinase
LLIAKLDRLARKVHFISGMMEANVEFVAVDLPFANRLTIHILAAVAEDEAVRISERTRAALKAAKRRGVKLGSPIAVKTIEAARAARSAYAAQSAAPTKIVIADIQAAGVKSLSGIARALQARGIKTPAGKDVWHARQVSRLLHKR